MTAARPPVGSAARRSPMPQRRDVDATLALALEGYEFISRRCRRYGTDVFETRLLLRRTICMRGADAARIFYDPDRFTRRGVMPRRVQKTLFGQGGVQGLDGDAHRDRKQLFMSLMTPDAISDLAALTAQRLREHILCWQRTDKVVVFDEVGRILCGAVCAWAGVPLADAQLQRRTDDLRAMIDSPARVGPAHWAGRRARTRAERWVGDSIEQVRHGVLQAPEGRALHAIACNATPAGGCSTPMWPRSSCSTCCGPRWRSTGS